MASCQLQLMWQFGLKCSFFFFFSPLPAPVLAKNQPWLDAAVQDLAQVKAVWGA